MKYTGHGSAKPFRVHEKDSELFELKSQDKKTAEKAARTKEALFGCMGAIGTHLILLVETMVNSLSQAKKGFSSGVDGKENAINDYKAESVNFSGDLLDEINKEFGPKLKQLLTVAAICYNI